MINFLWNSGPINEKKNYFYRIFHQDKKLGKQLHSEWDGFHPANVPTQGAIFWLEAIILQRLGISCRLEIVSQPANTICSSMLKYKKKTKINQYNNDVIAKIYSP